MAFASPDGPASSLRRFSLPVKTMYQSEDNCEIVAGKKPHGVEFVPRLLPVEVWLHSLRSI